MTVDRLGDIERVGGEIRHGTRETRGIAVDHRDGIRVGTLPLARGKGDAHVGGRPVGQACDIADGQVRRDRGAQGLQIHPETGGIRHSQVGCDRACVTNDRVGEGHIGRGDRSGGMVVNRACHGHRTCGQIRIGTIQAGGVAVDHRHVIGERTRRLIGERESQVRRGTVGQARDVADGEIRIGAEINRLQVHAQTGGVAHGQIRRDRAAVTHNGVGEGYIACVDATGGVLVDRSRDSHRAGREVRDSTGEAGGVAVDHRDIVGEGSGGDTVGERQSRIGKCSLGQASNSGQREVRVRRGRQRLQRDIESSRIADRHIGADRSRVADNGVGEHHIGDTDAARGMTVDRTGHNHRAGREIRIRSGERGGIAVNNSNIIGEGTDTLVGRKG